MPKVIPGFFLSLSLLLAPAVARAQSSSHWGVSGSVTPMWQVPTQLETLFGGTVDVKGSDVSIGFVCGRDLGGDWGVSFIRKTLKDRSRVEKIDAECLSNGCFQSGTSYLTQGVTLTGLKIHKYVPFVTIKKRVQAGMNFAGGFGQFKGNLESHEFDVETIFDSRTNTRTGRQSETTTIQPAKGLVTVSMLPLADIQAAVAVIVAPGFKVRAAGGLNLPGYNVFSITAVYLFGAR
jgi:hypothetical protein